MMLSEAAFYLAGRWVVNDCRRKMGAEILVNLLQKLLRGLLRELRRAARGSEAGFRLRDAWFSAALAGRVDSASADKAQAGSAA